MARDERTSTAVSSQSKLTNAQKIPPEVHQQLTKEFVPAVKEAALAGAELLRNFQALEKSSENYAHSLENLAKSAKTADAKAQEYGKELFEILQDYKKYVEYHKDCIKELTGIVTKTTIYSNEEKEKLKATFAGYQKEEKDITKAQKKGTKTQSEVDAFHEKQAREFLRQQELRYKFFLDKHKKWFSRYWALLERIQTERGFVVNGHAEVIVEKPAEDPVVVVPKVAIVAETPVLNGVTEEEAKPEEAAPAMIPPVVEVAPAVNGANDDPPFLHSGNSSPRSSISSMDKIPSRRNTNFEDSIAPISRTTTSTAVQSDSISAPVQVVHVPPPVERRETYQPSFVEQQQAAPRKFEYRGPIIVPAPVPRTREPEIIKPREAPIMVPRTVDAPVYVRTQSEVPQRYVAPPAERPHYHVDSQYNPSASPAHRPVSQNFAKPSAEQLVVPAMFNASDYGRTLTVTQDFNATSGEQMTVNRGDRVILIKSGSRGWIFIQDQATQRTGWVPSPFVSY